MQRVSMRAARHKSDINKKLVYHALEVRRASASSGIVGISDHMTHQEWSCRNESGRWITSGLPTTRRNVASASFSGFETRFLVSFFPGTSSSGNVPG